MDNSKVTSFSIDHMRLQPGVYVSRVDRLACGDVLVTYDIRLRRPNFEDALTPEVSHTIEHLGSIFLRSHPDHSSHIIYFGPMGCLTGMYLIYRWTSGQQMLMTTIASLVLSMMKFIVTYSGNLPSVGFDPEQCGNYSLTDLDGAKITAGNFLTLDDAFGTLCFEYPDDKNAAGVATSTQVFGNDRINNVLAQCRRVRRDISIDYTHLNVEVQSDIVHDTHKDIAVEKKTTTDNTVEDILMDDFIRQVKPADIALFLRKRYEQPDEDAVRKAFPEDSQEEQTIVVPLKPETEKTQKLMQKKSETPSSTKKKKKSIVCTGDALF